MSNQRPGMFVPALVGGAAAGILSGIPVLNCLCCLWIIGGAMLSAYLLVKDSPVALSAGDGAIVGIFSGIVAAVVDAFISIPFHALNAAFFQRIMESIAEYAQEMPSGWENWLERGAPQASGSMFMLGLLISVVVFSILGALGGIMGISLFGKKKIQKTQGAVDVPQDSSHRQP
ncbi:MAG: hypothetical protein ACLFVG_08360 [Candidatus Aminicenantes bacterium]